MGWHGIGWVVERGRKWREKKDGAGERKKVQMAVMLHLLTLNHFCFTKIFSCIHLLSLLKVRYRARCQGKEKQKKGEEFKPKAASWLSLQHSVIRLRLTNVSLPTVFCYRQSSRHDRTDLDITVCTLKNSCNVLCFFCSFVSHVLARSLHKSLVGEFVYDYNLQLNHM